MGCGSSAALACCPEGKEGYCSYCNHCCGAFPMCCECCPCGADGCLGYPNHLCVWCGNCNLMWYESCCACCFVADLSIATIENSEEAAEKWASVVCTLVTFFLTGTVLSRVLPLIAADSAPIGIIGSAIGGIFSLLGTIYMMIIFGKAATAIAEKQSIQYEPAECCNGCCGEEKTCGGCCPSCLCCLTYCCCYHVHSVQVARTMEERTELTTNIIKGRPAECQCCNCWSQPGLETGGSATDAL